MIKDVMELPANHRFQVNIQRRIYNHATDVEIRALNEVRAVKAASDFIGEAVVFSVAGAFVIYEVSRSTRSEARKEEGRKKELEDLRKRGEILAVELDALRARVDELERMKGRSITSWIPGLARTGPLPPQNLSMGPNSSSLVSAFGPSVLCSGLEGAHFTNPGSILLHNFFNFSQQGGLRPFN